MVPFSSPAAGCTLSAGSISVVLFGLLLIVLPLSHRCSVLYLAYASVNSKKVISKVVILGFNGGSFSCLVLFVLFDFPPEART